MAAPLDQPSSVARRGRPAIAPLAAGALLGGVLVATAGADDGLVLCPFRRCTGGYCPGCGTTRAAHEFVRGDLAASWSHHPWIALAALQLVVLGAITARVPAARRPARLRRLAVPLLLANSAIMIGIWIARLSTGAIPTGWL